MVCLCSEQAVFRIRAQIRNVRGAFPFRQNGTLPCALVAEIGTIADGTDLSPSIVEIHEVTSFPPRY